MWIGVFDSYTVNRSVEKWSIGRLKWRYLRNRGEKGLNRSRKVNPEWT